MQYINYSSTLIPQTYDANDNESKKSLKTHSLEIVVEGTKEEL